jgi:neutral ceramidase
LDYFNEKGVWTSDSHIAIAGLSNSYSHYITTFEEYQEQRYEGASTMYGPHTLAAYQQIYDDLATKLALNQSVPSGPAPYDMRGKTFSYVLPPIWDGMFIKNENFFSFLNILNRCTYWKEIW